MNFRNNLKKIAAGAAVAASSVAAFAQTAPSDPATALDALKTFSGTTTGYGPILFGLAVVSTGIMIGVAWIKKARGAAK